MRRPPGEVPSPKAMECLEEGFDEVINILAFPKRSTNSQERFNEEIRRRECVIWIFPNEESAIRLIGALLTEFHEQWSTGKKYLDMTEYLEWKKQKDSFRSSATLRSWGDKSGFPFWEEFTAHLGLAPPLNEKYVVRQSSSISICI